MVNTFKKGTATAESLFGDLGLEYSQTVPGTGVHAPGDGDIELDRRISEGSFGVVTYLWNVSTGKERVVKEPLAKVARHIRMNRQEDGAWRQEACIMQTISHVRFYTCLYIVSLLIPSLAQHCQASRLLIRAVSKIILRIHASWIVG